MIVKISCGNIFIGLMTRLSDAEEENQHRSGVAESGYRIV